MPSTFFFGRKKKKPPPPPPPPPLQCCRTQVVAMSYVFTPAAQSSLNGSKLLQFWPHAQPWCDVMPACGWCTVTDHCTCTAPCVKLFFFLTGASSSFKASFRCETQPSAAKRCLTAIASTASSPQPCLLQSRNDDNDYLFNTVGRLMHWSHLMAAFINTGIEIKLPGAGCRDPSASPTLTGWYRVGSFLAVASEAFSNSIRGPVVWVLHTFSPYQLSRTFGVLVFCACVCLFDKMKTTEWSPTCGGGGGGDVWLAGCLCSTTD